LNEIVALFYYLLTISFSGEKVERTQAATHFSQKNQKKEKDTKSNIREVYL
jgi:hypothetical protein